MSARKHPIVSSAALRKAQRSALVMLIFPVAAVPDALAADQTWDGGSGGTGTAYHTLTNWAGDTAYAGATGSSGNTDTANFTAGTGTSIQMNFSASGLNTATFSLGAMNFARASGAATWNTNTTTGGTVRLNGATVNTVANTLVRVGGTVNLTIANGSSSALNLQLANSGFMEVASGRTLTVTSGISELSAGTGFDKTGPGVLVVNPSAGSNSLTGTVNLAGGTLTASPNGMGSTAKLVLNPTGIATGLIFNNGLTAAQMLTTPAIFTTPMEVAGPVAFGNSTTGGPLIHDGTLTLSGSNTSHIITLSRDLVQRAAITDNGNNVAFVKDGTNNLRLTTANSFSGGFTFRGTGTAANGANNIVWVGNDSAFGTGKLSILAGATRLSSDSATSRTIPNAVDFGDDITLGHFNAAAAVTVASATAGYDATIVPANTPTGKLTFSGSLGDVRITGGNRILTAAADFEISAGIKEDVAGRTLTKSGTALLTLSGANSYTGVTTVFQGELQLTGSLAGGASLFNGTTLSGTGAISGLVTSKGGTISPGLGSGTGTLTTGAVTLDANSFLTLTINDETPGGLDRIVNSGTFAANSATLNVTFADSTFSQATSAADLASATRYGIVTGPVDTTVFGNVSLMSAVDVATLGLTGPQYEATFSGQRFWLETGSFNLVPVAQVLTPIPEPATAGVLTLGALVIASRRRRF